MKNDNNKIKRKDDKMVKIDKIHGHEILDSRGNPTVSVTVMLSDGSAGTGAAPSGASTGKYEAHELRDGDKFRYQGKGVLKAVDNINRIIAPALTKIKNPSVRCVDKCMMELDGTENKENLGANSTLAVSIAVTRALAAHYHMSLFRYIGGISAVKMPVPMMNILNGGAHADNNIDIQEFMIMPVGAESFGEGLRWCSEIYHCLGNILKDKGLGTAVGDEGGFAPNLSRDEEAIEIIIDAIEKAGYGTDSVKLAIDAAGSEWADGEGYTLPKRGKFMLADELIEYWADMVKKYPIISIEDPLSEEDWDGFTDITKAIGKNIQIVGDDLFVTNPHRLEKGIMTGAANAILIKPNQIGTVSETIDTVVLAKKYGYRSVISHRSGETEDTFIADLAVALNAGQIKTGAPCRSERVAKYNRLLKIESMIH